MLPNVATDTSQIVVIFIVIMLICCCYFLARCQLDYPAFKISFQQCEKSVQNNPERMPNFLRNLPSPRFIWQREGRHKAQMHVKGVKDHTFISDLVQDMLPAPASHTALRALVWLAAFPLPLFLPWLLSPWLLLLSSSSSQHVWHLFDRLQKDTVSL